MTTGESRVTLTRGRAYVDKARGYKVLLDGGEIDRIRDGETKTFPVPAGSHQLQVKVDWAASPPFTFELAPGAELRLACRPNANAFTALIYSLFARNKYLRLEREGDAVSDDLRHSPDDGQG